MSEPTDTPAPATNPEGTPVAAAGAKVEAADLIKLQKENEKLQERIAEGQQTITRQGQQIATIQARIAETGTAKPPTMAAEMTEIDRRLSEGTITPEDAGKQKTQIFQREQAETVRKSAEQAGQIANYQARLVQKIAEIRKENPDLMTFEDAITQEIAAEAQATGLNVIDIADKVVKKWRKNVENLKGKAGSSQPPAPAGNGGVGDTAPSAPPAPPARKESFDPADEIAERKREMAARARGTKE